MYIFIGVFLLVLANVIWFKICSKQILSVIRTSDYSEVALLMLLYILGSIVIVIAWPFTLIIGGIFALAFGIKHLADKTGE